MNTRPACGSRRGWPLPQTGPTLWKTKGLCPRTEWACLKASPVRCSRRRCHPGAQGPVAESRGRKRAWLPAPLVWTWVRAYRQLHAGNAGLRPATTSFPFALLYRMWVTAGSSVLDRRGCAYFRFRSIHAGAMGCAHAENAPCSNSSCQSKKAKAALSIPRQRSRD